MNLKIINIVILTLVSFGEIYSQDEIVKVKPLLMEMGIGYPYSLTERTQNFDAHINLGFQKQVKNYFVGLISAGQYRQNVTNDFSGNIKARLGTILSSNHNLSIDLGYTLKSRKHGVFPGPTFGINLDKTNKYGFHLRYDEFSSTDTEQEKIIVVGLHLSSSKVTKIGLPVVGGVLVITSLILLISGIGT